METTKRQGRVADAKSDVIRRLPEACRDERAAVEFMERERWGGEAYCPHCGSFFVYAMRDRKTGGRSKRFLWRCRDCKLQFTVRVGTVFEDSRIPLRIWCHAFWRACASKKGVSALQISRETGLSYKSALFLMHRIRWAMNDDSPGMLGEGGGIVEADETYVGGKGKRVKGRPLGTTKVPVVAVVERGGKIRPRHVTVVNAKTLRAFVKEHVHESATLMTDELHAYRGIGREFAGHEAVKHKEMEFVRGKAHTQTLDGFFSLLKRGINGTFHSVSKKHLHRYLDEFAFRYNARDVDDGERTHRAIRAAAGKRLVYRQPKVKA